MKFILIVCITGMLLVYLGFPFFLWLINRFSGMGQDSRYLLLDNNFPSLQIILSCFNEAEIIDDRIKNILDQDYPNNKLSVLIISDGSTDKSDEIVKQCSLSYQNIDLLTLSANFGKNRALNIAHEVNKFQAQLLCFTDADSLFEPGALKSAVRSFADPKVGLVGGKISYWLGEGSAQQTEGFFWRLENFLRQVEGKLGILVSCPGQCILMRRELFQSLPNDVNTDFAMPLMVLAQGYQTRFDKNAVVRSMFPTEQKEVLKRRQRTIIRAMTTIATYKRNLPWHIRQVLFWHKTARFVVFPMQVTALYFNLALTAMSPSTIWMLLFGMQLTFYGLAFLGWLADRCKLRIPFVHLPYQFTLQNAVAFGAVMAYWRGQRVARWTPPR